MKMKEETTKLLLFLPAPTLWPERKIEEAEDSYLGRVSLFASFCMLTVLSGMLLLPPSPQHSHATVHTPVLLTSVVNIRSFIMLSCKAKIPVIPLYPAHFVASLK